MLTFQYSAVDDRGASQSGQLEAADRDAAELLLREQGFTQIVLSAVQSDASPRAAAKEADWQTVQAVAALANSGLPIIAGVRALAAESGRTAQARWLSRLADHLERGESLQDAVSYERSIPPAVAELLRISPTEDAALGALNQYMNLRRSVEQIRRSLVLASIYPVVLLTVIAIVAAVAIMIIREHNVKILQDWGVSRTSLPVTMVELLTNPNSLFWPAMAVFVGCCLVAILVGGPGSFSALFSRLLLIGGLPRCFAMGERLTLVSLLLGQGATLPRALSLVAEGGGSKEYRNLFRYWTDAIREGVSWSQAIGRQGSHFALLETTIAWGEQSSSLPEACRTAADIYLARATWQANFVRVVLPVLLFLLCAYFVAIFIQSIMLPTVTLIQSLS